MNVVRSPWGQKRQNWLWGLQDATLDVFTISSWKMMIVEFAAHCIECQRKVIQVTSWEIKSSSLNNQASTVKWV